MDILTGPTPSPSRSLPSAAPPPVPLRETVLVVHGTFAQPWVPAGGPNWWMPGGSFCVALDDALSRRGSAARTWHHLRTTRQPFRWSSANSERARRRAGFALLDALHALEADPAIDKVHLVAHSHGGNVVLSALRSTTASLPKLGQLVFMGVPFVSCDDDLHRPSLHVGLLSALLIAASVLGAAAWWMDEYGRIAALSLLVLLTTMGVHYLLDYARRQRTRGHVLSRLHGHVFAFDSDEARRGLDACVELRARQPEIMQMMAADAPPATSAEPPLRDAEQPFRYPHAFLRWLGRQDAHAELRDLRDEDVPTSLGMPSPRTPTSATGQVLRWMDQALQFLPVGGIGAGAPAGQARRFLRGLVSLLALALSPLIAIGDRLDDARAWVIARLRRRAVRMGLNAAVGMALGDDMRGARVQGIHPLPKDLACRRYDVPGALRDAVTARADRSASAFTAAVWSRFGMQGLFELAGHVRTLFTADDLVHAQYYRETELTEQIADLVAHGHCDWPCVEVPGARGRNRTDTPFGTGF